MKYAFDHPDILDKIPSDAELIIFPNDDPAIRKLVSEYNEKKKEYSENIDKNREWL